jgi:hypothetical protein
MLKKISKFFLVICILIMPVLVDAQPPDIEEDPNYGVEDVHVPFDNGVGLLVGVGILYGILKSRAARKGEKNKKSLLLN